MHCRRGRSRPLHLPAARVSCGPPQQLERHLRSRNSPCKWSRGVRACARGCAAVKLAACRPAPARFTPAPTMQRRTLFFFEIPRSVPLLFAPPLSSSNSAMHLAPASALFSLHSNALHSLWSCPPPSPPLQIVSKIVFAPSQRPLLKANVAARARLPRPRLSPLQPTMGHAILPQVRLPGFCAVSALSVQPQNGVARALVRASVSLSCFEAFTAVPLCWIPVL